MKFKIHSGIYEYGPNIIGYIDQGMYSRESTIPSVSSIRLDEGDEYYSLVKGESVFLTGARLNYKVGEKIVLTSIQGNTICASVMNSSKRMHILGEYCYLPRKQKKLVKNQMILSLGMNNKKVK
jgi:hypothetical protein